MSLRKAVSSVARFVDRITDSRSTMFVLNSLDMIRRYGEIVDLQIDRDNREILIATLLQGEARPITVVIKSYDFSREGKVTLFTVNRIQCLDRQWVDTLVKDAFVGKPMVVPEMISEEITTFLSM